MGSVIAGYQGGGAITNGQKLDKESVLTFTAEPNTGYIFNGWHEGDLKVSEELSYTRTVSGELSLVAKFSKGKYALSFEYDALMGEVASSGNVKSGDSIEYNTEITLTAEEKTGYNFLGWYVGSERVSSDKEYTFNMPASTYELEARFSKTSFVLGFECDAAMGDITADGTVKNGDAVEYNSSVALTAKEKAGYRFIGWFNGNVKVSGDNKYIFNMPAENYSLIAKFEKESYALNFGCTDKMGSVSADGGINSGELVEFEKTVTLTATEKTGYDFVGWYVLGAEVSTDKKYTFNMPAEGYTVEARFKAQKRTVSFYDGYTVVYRESVDYGTSVDKFTDISKANCTFKGWFDSQALDAKLYDFQAPVTESINLYARWEADIVKHEVKFVYEDGTVIYTQEYEDGAYIIQKPSTANKNDSNFDGWYYFDSAEEKYIELESDYTVKSDVTVVAIYKLKEFTVEFYNGGTVYDRKTVKYGEKATRPVTPSKTDYVFAGWTDAHGSLFNFDIAITDTIKLYASWNEATKETFTVKFYDTKGGTLLDSQTVEKGGFAIMPDNASKTGYDFVGWLYNNGTADAVFDGRVEINANVDVIASFTVKTYKVVFKDYDGSVLKAEQIVNYGAAAIAPADPERVGYDFVGWDKSFSSVTDDMTITAKYKVILLKVEYKDGNSLISSRDDVEYGAFLSVPSTPSKDGCSFIGWFKDKELTQKFDFAATKITDNTVIYASFETIKLKEYNVVFKQPGGEIISSQKVVEGDSAINPGNPTKIGHKFIGWDKEFSNVTENLEIFAEYEIIKYEVKFFEIDGVTQIGATQLVPYGTVSTPPAAPSVANKYFLKWSADATSVITENTEFTAIYANEIRHVTFKLSDNPDENIVENVEHGGFVNIPNTPTKPGYTFNGWFVENTDGLFDFSTPITADTVLEARYTKLANIFVVTFTAGGGAYGNIQLVAENGYAMQPAPYDDGTATEYIWCLEGSSEEFAFATTPITTDITLYAKAK